MARKLAGRSGGKWGAAGGGAGCGAEEALEVGGEPDMRGRPGSERGEEEGKGEGADERAPGGSDWKKKEKGERGRCWAAEERRAGLLGRARRAGSVEKEEGGWAEREREKEFKEVFSFFLQSFSF
jgi:hypothetical protein